MLLTISGYDPQKLSKTCASYLYIRVELSQLFGTLTPSLICFETFRLMTWRQLRLMMSCCQRSYLDVLTGLWQRANHRHDLDMRRWLFNFSVVIVGPFFWHHHSNLRCRWEFNGCTLTRTNQFSRKTTPPFWCVRIIRRIQFLWLTAEHQWEVSMLYSCGLQF